MPGKSKKRKGRLSTIRKKREKDNVYKRKVNNRVIREIKKMIDGKL